MSQPRTPEEVENLKTYGTCEVCGEIRKVVREVAGDETILSLTCPVCGPGPTA